MKRSTGFSPLPTIEAVVIGHKKLEKTHFKKHHNVDFIVMCSGSPHIINAWNKSAYSLEHAKRPMIFLARKNDRKFGKYQLSSPINPGKLIKLLDYFTIRELNYLPEFEIGTESHEIADLAASGLKILQSNARTKIDRSVPAKSVLVVDDSLAVRRQMEIQFRLRNVQLDIVKSAEEAMTAIEDKRYDIVFLDVVMPGMDGYTACKKIKKNKKNTGTPVILLTSRSSSFDKIKGALAGCDAYLIKPINHNEFELVYDKYIQHNYDGGQAHAS